MEEETGIKMETIAETASFIAWKSEEPDGEVTFHIEFGTVTMHFFKEEWEEFIELARALS